MRDRLRSLSFVSPARRFVDSHICGRLARSGHEVISVDDDFTGRWLEPDNRRRLPRGPPEGDRLRPSRATRHRMPSSVRTHGSRPAWPRPTSCGTWASTARSRSSSTGAGEPPGLVRGSSTPFADGGLRARPEAVRIHRRQRTPSWSGTTATGSGFPFAMAYLSVYGPARVWVRTSRLIGTPGSGNSPTEDLPVAWPGTQTGIFTQ